MLVDRKSRASVEQFLGSLADTCRTAGTRVVDEREPASDEGASRAPELEIEVGRYPLAGVPDDGSKGVVRECCRCGELLKLSRWDDANGFLVQCPYCGGIHGKRWRVYSILLASLLLNGISFFTTMRWKRALPLCLVFIGGFFADDQFTRHWPVPQTAELAIAAALLLGPLAINAVLVLRHEMVMDTASTRIQVRDAE